MSRLRTERLRLFHSLTVAETKESLVKDSLQNGTIISLSNIVDSYQNFYSNIKINVHIRSRICNTDVFLNLIDIVFIHVVHIVFRSKVFMVLCKLYHSIQ